MKKTNTPALYVHSNGIYYLRRQIPEGLRSHFSKGTHWKESRGVRDNEVAKPLFAMADARWQMRKSEALQELGANALATTPERASVAASSAMRT